MTQSTPLTTTDLCTTLGIQPPPGLADTIVHGVTTLERASDTDASYLLKERYAPVAAKSAAALILVPNDLPLDDPRALHVPDVWIAILALLEHFHPTPQATGTRHPTAIIADSAEIAPDVDVGPYAIIGDNTHIGPGTIIDAHAIIEHDVEIGTECRILKHTLTRHGTRIGDRVIIHAGAIIGDDGFKYEMAGGRLRKVPQVGIVVIEDDVEIGANTTIDRAGFHETRIGARTKIDNLVHVAHNVTIGSDTIVIAQVGIAGSTRVGRGVMLGGQVGVKDNVTIGDGARIGAQSGISSNVPTGADMFGSPAIPMKDYLRGLKAFKRLPWVMDEVLPILREWKKNEAEGPGD